MSDVFQPRPGVMVGSLDPSKVRDGVPRGRHGAWQRRVRASVFGEPLFEAELVPESVCAARPHIWAYSAWEQLHHAGLEAGLPSEHLAIYSAYRSVAFQREIFEYRLNERRERRRAEGLPELSERELRKVQQKWTAAPGQSAHHTGFALDLGLYHLGVRDGRRSPTYDWLLQNARAFGFYPYLPEPWHWEYNPPGLVARLREFRTAVEQGGRPAGLLAHPRPIPATEPANDC